IRVGTRGSKLALIQTQSVIDVLKKAFPEHTFECVIIHTKGDKNESSLAKIGGNGLFIREIEEQLIQGNIQMAIHSMKDCPIELKKGLTLSKAWKREDNHDVCILNQTSWKDLKPHARIATGSIRRKKQVEALRKDIEVIDIRGNIDTRIRKMKENGYDGLILAKAGLNRLSISSDYVFSYEEMCPSPCQGALAIECREDNVELLQMLDTFYDEKTETEVCCERSFLKEMKCSCQNPIGACATYENGNLHLYAMYGDEKLYYAHVDGKYPEQVAFEAAKMIRKQMKHHVTLVSAGPGNIKDVTISAFEVVSQADCILYDRLIPKELLSYAKKDCECIYVGKASHHHTMTQDEINALLVEKSLQYKHVVRLKGGDIFVLARGQEEIQALKDRGISCSTISGVSSCIAAPASAGIPLTMRNVSTGFHVMSAHNTKGEFSHLDFKALAKSQDTLVFLMGLSKVKQIAQKLMDEGMASNMPMALISQATTMHQKTLYTTLEQIQHQRMDLKSPCMIVIGRCVQFHNENKKEIIFPKIGKESISLDLPG
ncbi:MAG: hydroxymethylbilane synthase, partial [Floccifex sp.]